MDQIRRGDIFLVDLTPVTGTELEGVRPALVIQNDIANRFSPTVIIAAITSKITEAKLPTHVNLNAKTFNLHADSVALLEQIRTVDKMRLIEKLSSISEDSKIMEHVNEAYLISGGVIPFTDGKIRSEKNYYRYKLNDVLDILEDNQYEFKEIKNGNPKNSISNTLGMNATSFLNSEGGRILYGISDDRVVKGFKADNKLLDEIKQVIYGSLRTIGPKLSADHYQVSFHPVYDNNAQRVEDLYVLEIVVPPSRDKKTIYFHNDNEIHIRLDGVRHKLLSTEIVSFVQRRLMD